MREAFDKMEEIVRTRAAEAARRVRDNVSDLTTTPTTTRIRSGDAVAAMGHEVTRNSDFDVTAEVGSIYAPSPSKVEQYLNVHEYGQYVYPKVADKLAIPPADNWDHRVRDALGAQIATAKEIYAAPRNYGFSGLVFTEEEIFGADIATGALEFLFHRRDWAYIPPRQPVARELPAMEAAVAKDLNALVVD